MTTLQSEEDCQTNDLNDSFPMAIESLRFPLDNSMQIVFNGYYNGFNVEVRSVDELSLLYHMGCFGKGSASRSRPRQAQSECSPQILRKRQFSKRNYWYNKFGHSEETTNADLFLKDIDELTANIVNDGIEQAKKDVIDLVSSDDDKSDSDSNSTGFIHNLETFHNYSKDDTVVIVPNSDSEDDDYFAKLKPKCCVNRIKIKEKLMLTLHEAFFLTYGLGCLQVISLDNNLLSLEQCWEMFSKTDIHFLVKYVVYHYFRSKGYIVKPGIKFGGDYLLYKEGPGLTHADYIVVIKDDRHNYDWISILGHIRMAATTVKEILLVEVNEPDECVILPKGLSSYHVRETLLTRNIPVIINNED